VRRLGLSLWIALSCGLGCNGGPISDLPNSKSDEDEGMFPSHQPPGTSPAGGTAGGGSPSGGVPGGVMGGSGDPVGPGATGGTAGGGFGGTTGAGSGALGGVAGGTAGGVGGTGGGLIGGLFGGTGGTSGGGGAIGGGTTGGGIGGGGPLDAGAAPADAGGNADAGIGPGGPDAGPSDGGVESGPASDAGLCPTEARARVDGGCQGSYCSLTLGGLGGLVLPGACSAEATLRLICDAQLARKTAQCAQDNALSLALGSSVRSCLRRDPQLAPVESGCVDCYVTELMCTLSNCLATCVAGFELECTSCRRQACGPAFTSCSGLPAL
jgi:hypothetical protein